MLGFGFFLLETQRRKPAGVQQPESPFKGSTGQLPLSHTLSHLGKRSPAYLPCSDSVLFLFFLVVPLTDRRSLSTSSQQSKILGFNSVLPNSSPLDFSFWIWSPKAANPPPLPSPPASCVLSLLLGLVLFRYFLELYSPFPTKNESEFQSAEW